MKTGILGGTFDPPHYGHLNLAAAALAGRCVDRVVLITANIPPHKFRPDLTPPYLRHHMAALLAQNCSNVDVSDIELDLSGVSYTYNTIQRLKELHPDDEFRLIIGADMAIIFDTWRFATELMQIAPPLIAARPGFEFPEGFGSLLPADLLPADRQKLATGVFPLSERNISSTQLREMLYSGAKSAELSQYIPENVLDFIITEKIYPVKA